MGDRRKPRGGSHGPSQDDPIQSGLEEWEIEAGQTESGGESDGVEDSGES